ncbi:GNAT family N-acetyltransferase [Dactylosporangium sp. NPDC049140]|uniref:GNAT family N-acetyltransferase n=1 Tax=Dactylosporangium sp. NPDC049140 TaxID=3155647 RepID=UPI0033D50A4A
MGLLSRWRGPQPVSGVRWRSLRPQDREAIIELAGLSVAADGATQATYAPEFYLGMFGAQSVGGFAGEQLVAAAALPTRLEPTIEGHVHPSYRGRGLGGAVLDWALARVPADAVVKAPALTAEKQRLFESRGLHLTAALDRMWRPLGEPVEIAPPPPGVSIAAWDDADGFGVYAESFADRPDSPFAPSERPGRSFEDWMRWTGDMELDESLSLLARDEEGAAVGFVTCWTGGPVQAGTVPAWRRRGLGIALLSAAMAAVAARPDYEEAAEISVNADNVAAVRLFRRCGFHPDSREAYFTARPETQRRR